jgi:hypothetical protein
MNTNMGSILSHEHTSDCCPTDGQWCERLDRYSSSLHYALNNKYSDSECSNAISKIKNIRTSTVAKNALYYAVQTPHTQLTQQLIDRGMDIHEHKFIGNNALHIAAEYQPSQVKLLINNGANIHAKNSLNQTALYITQSWGQRESCVLLLEEGAIMNRLDYEFIISSYGFKPETYSIMVAYGLSFGKILPHGMPYRMPYVHVFGKIEPDRLSQYLTDVADAAFSRRKAAIRWWFGRNV